MNIHHFKILTYCDGAVYNIIDQDINNMQITVPGATFTSQTFSQFKDTFGVLDDHKCGPVVYSLEVFY